MKIWIQYHSFTKQPKPSHFFKPRKPVPTDDDNVVLKTILGLAIAEAVRAAMDSHYFTVGDQFFKQIEGGAIGNDLTGEIAKIIMLLWNEMFLNKLRYLGLTEQVYKRFADDIVMAIEEILNKTYDNETNTLVPRDSNEPSDKQTFMVLTQIADSIEDNIKMEYDVPSLHDDKKVIVLDLKVDVYPQGNIRYTFYKKPMAHPMTIMKRSAVSMTIKRNTIYNECTRRMKNTAVELGWSETANHLSEYMNCLRISGYPARFRYNILKGAIKKEQKLRQKLEANNEMRHRSREDIILDKANKLGRYAHTWQIRNSKRNVLRVNATPNSKLANKMKAQLKDLDWPMIGRTMVAENSGASVTQKLYKTNPFRSKGCEYNEKCPVNGKHDCMEMELTYEVTCKICKTIGGDEELERNRGRYVGVTGRTGHKRGSEHMNSAKTMDKKYGIGKHYSLHHSNVAAMTEDPVEMKILSSQPKLLDRLIDEGIRLEKAPQLENLKSEWGRGGGLVRLVAEKTQETRHQDTSTTERRYRQINSQDNQDTPNIDIQVQNDILEDNNLTQMTQTAEQEPRYDHDQAEQDTDIQERPVMDLGTYSQPLEPRRNPRRHRRQVRTQYDDIVNY